MDSDETESLAELRDQGRRAYDLLNQSLQVVNAVTLHEMRGTPRNEVYDQLNIANNHAVMLYSLLTDTWQAAEVEAERYHRLREELEDAATNA